MDYEKIIEEYEALRGRCYKLARENDGKRMGEYAWLRFAMQEEEINMQRVLGGIECYGSTYTTQTMDFESFDFFVPLSELD